MDERGDSFSVVEFLEKRCPRIKGTATTTVTTTTTAAAIVYGNISELEPINQQARKACHIVFSTLLVHPQIILRSTTYL